jgi:hypothetical protein
MILANYAEVNGGLIYMLGAGWDTVTARAPLPEGAPPDMFVALNGTLLIRLLLHHPTETDREHTFKVTIVDEDGNELGNFEGSVTVPRAPGYPPTWDQPFAIPIPLMGVGLPRPGQYRFSLEVNGQFIEDKPFRVLKGF